MGEIIIRLELKNALNNPIKYTERVREDLKRGRARDSNAISPKLFKKLQKKNTFHTCFPQHFFFFSVFFIHFVFCFVSISVIGFKYFCDWLKAMVKNQQINIFKLSSKCHKFNNFNTYLNFICPLQNSYTVYLIHLQFKQN